MPGGLGGISDPAVSCISTPGPLLAGSHRQGGQVGYPWRVSPPAGHVDQVLVRQACLLHEQLLQHGREKVFQGTFYSRLGRHVLLEGDRKCQLGIGASERLQDCVDQRSLPYRSSQESGAKASCVGYAVQLLCIDSRPSVTIPGRMLQENESGGLTLMVWCSINCTTPDVPPEIRLLLNWASSMTSRDCR